MIKKLKTLLTPTKWKTVWSKSVKGWSAGIFGGVERNVPMTLKLQISNKNRYRFLLTDGEAENTVDTYQVVNYISDAREAMILNNCNF